MKKMFSLILALLLALSMAGCTRDPEPSTEPTTEPTPPVTTTPTTMPTTAPTEPSLPDESEPSVEIVVQDLPMYAISLTNQTEVTQGNDGQTVFEYTYQNIRLLLPDAEMSISINLDILNRIDATRAVATDIMNDAVAAAPEYPYSYTILYTPKRVDTGVLSLFGQQASYSGGSTLSSGHGLTYDLTTGTVLTLEDVLVPGTSADVICPLVIDALAALPEEYYLYGDYSITVEDRFSGNFLSDEGWYLSDEGLCFVFAPYEVAPYSTGFVQAVIPYDQLTGVLNDPWFPGEQVTPSGALEVLPFTQEDAAQFDQFAELYLDREGGSYLFHSTGLIYDLVIESGFWNLDGTVFTPEKTVFKASSLVPSDAVMIQTDIPDTLPHLRITYTAAEGTVTVYLSDSGEDGTPLLLTY